MSIPKAPPGSTANGSLPAPRFKPTDEVQMRREPSRHGMVTGSALKTARGWQYQVFFGNEKRFVVESDLEPVNELELNEKGQVRLGSLDDLLRQLVLVKKRKGLADSLFAYGSSRTQFEVYQFKPALKFLSNPDQRLLIADEVGLGKTIEAGIIFLELQARLESLSRVLVVCPSNLKQKWYDEFRSRFDETFEVLDTTMRVRKFLDGYKRMREHTRLKGIVSLELLRMTEFAEAFATQRVHFDLVIVDEAHHCKNPESMSNHVVTVLSDNADAMLLLTATPLQVGDQDLFALLQLLSPGEFDNLAAFRQRLEPNQYINAATRLLAAQKIPEALQALRKVEATPEPQRFIQNPFYQEVIGLLQKSSLRHDELISVQRRMFSLNTLASIFTRTRKREVMLKAPVRTAYTLRVTFTPEERKFYDAIISYVREQFMWKTGSNFAPAWAVMMRERQTASCISAMREFFAQSLQGKDTNSVEDDTLLQGIVDDDLGMRNVSLPTSVKTLLRDGAAIGNLDTKLAVFLKAVRGILAADPNTKILLFSFFRGTLEYLYKRLNNLGFGVVMMHGGYKVSERQATVEDFRNNPAINILLSSEVGSEGLDFQFCHTLFNYDLPWNPMKIEQRIGRIDRFGQESSQVRIYNLVMEDTIEERIFLRLYERIGIFEAAIGDLEAILGQEIQEISKQLYSNRLTPIQEEELANQAARNIIRRKQEMEEFEGQRLNFMGQDAIFTSEIEHTIDSGRFVSEAELHALVKTFLNKSFPRNRLHINGDSTYFLDLDHDFVQHMKGFVYDKSRGGDPTAEDFLRRIAEKAPEGIPITFSASLAYDRKLVEFVTLRHPIAEAAIDYWNRQGSVQVPVSRIVVDGDRELAGDYYFFVYSLDIRGLERQSTLIAVTIASRTLKVVTSLGEHFLKLIQEAKPETSESSVRFDESRFREAKAIATSFVAEERDRREAYARQSNEALVNARVVAKTQTYQIKRQMVKTYSQRATDPRIRRMRESQLRNMDSQHASTLSKLMAQKEIGADFGLELAGVAKVIQAI